MKVLVTGAAGFIGSTLSEALVRGGNHVVGIDSLTAYYPVEEKLQNIAGLEDHLGWEFIAEDLVSADLESLLQDIDVVFHLAGQPGVRKSWGSEFEAYIDANIRATQRLLEAARSSAIKRFVYASSSSVYGDAETYPTTEATLPGPISPYGVSKLAAEHLVTLYAKQFDIPSVSLRFFTVYGPRQRPDMAFRRFITSVLAGEALTVYGDGTQVREFTFVDDIVEACIRAAVTDVPPGSVINLSGGSAVSVNDVIGTLEAVSGRSIAVDHLPPVAGDVYRTGGSTEAARRLLDWHPVVALQEGLRRQWDWALTLSDGG